MSGQDSGQRSGNNGKRITRHIDATFHIPGEVAVQIYEAVQRGDTHRGAELLTAAMIAAGVVPAGTRPEDLDTERLVIQIGNHTGAEDPGEEGTA